MNHRLSKALLLLAITALLAGCASWREQWLQWRLGLAGQPTVEPALQVQLDRLYAEGATALAANNLDAAIAAWRAHTRIAPPALAQARRLRGYLTLLERESARRFARQAAAREAPRTAAASADRLQVAIFPLAGRTTAPGDPFGRALLAMISVDLAKVPSLTLLERERIDALLRERQLAGSGLVDASTLGTQAALLGAGSVIAGAVLNEPSPAGPGEGRYKINTAVSSVGEGGRVLGTQEADGRQAEFFRLQKEIVYGILKTLGVTDIPPGVAHVHTRSWAAYARFANGLALLAEDRFDEARAAFLAALRLDPGFALAEQAFHTVPARAATIDDIRAELRATP
jgi:tetratricopeptide (TPR) repeat protein